MSKINEDFLNEKAKKIEEKTKIISEKKSELQTKIAVNKNKIEETIKQLKEFGIKDVSVDNDDLLKEYADKIEEGIKVVEDIEKELEAL